MTRGRLSTALAACGVLLVATHGGLAADWPQFMRTAAHTGDAADETLKLPLGLLAQVKLGDAVTTSPAVVNGRVYVVDQMGTAYCIDPEAGRIVWQTSPDGSRAMGSNTSSPCVANGRIYYGTTAGTLHILDARNGDVVKTVDVGSPILGSAALANDSIYVQTLDAVVRCFGLDGDERWQWDHYRDYTKPLPEKLKRYHPGSYDRPHFGGNEVAVAGRMVVSSIGWDQFCLEDKGDTVSLVWCNRAALGKDAGIPRSASISDGFVYTAWPGVDGAGSLVRFSLEDGSRRKGDTLGRQWAILGTPAVRGATAYWGRHIRGVSAYEFGKGAHWNSFVWTNQAGFTPTITSPALAKGHCVFTTLDGELIIVDLASRGSDLPRLSPKPFRFKTPSGRVIGSSPAISGGRVYFGCDDGYLYVLGPEGTLQPKAETLTLHKPRGKAMPATGKTYEWPSPYGGPGNANFVDDAALKPPFAVRWAVRSFGNFKQPVSATEKDVIYVTLAGTVVCLEQATGRLRWRRRLQRQRWARPGVLCAGGRVYVPRPRPRVKPGNPRRMSALFCLDGETGHTVWAAEIGAGHSTRAAPVLVGGVVAYGSLREIGPVVDAWNAETGKPVWQVALKVTGRFDAPSGCAADGVMFFSTGGGHKDTGETVAIEAKTGRVLWRTNKAHCSGSGTPAVKDGRVYTMGWEKPISCLSAKDGSLIWQGKGQSYWFHSPSLGPDYFTVRGYSGSAQRLNLADGTPQRIKNRGVTLGGPGHACGPVVLTSGGLSIAVTVSGLHIRDVQTGELLWLSKGFAPRACSNPIVANGRIFYNPQVDGVLFCFEPESTAGRR